MTLLLLAGVTWVLLVWGLVVLCLAAQGGDQRAEARAARPVDSDPHRRQVQDILSA